MRAPSLAGTSAWFALLGPLATGCVITLSASNTPPSDGGSSNTGDGSGSSSTSSNVNVNLDLPDGSTGQWTNVTSNLGNLASACGNMDYVVAKPDEDLLIAGVSLQGLWGSRDGGQTWTALGSGAGSAVIDNGPTDIVFDPQTSTRWWESGIYGTTEGVYETTDDGVTFTAVGTIHYNDTLTIDFSDPSRKTLLAGAHEMAQTLYRSTDEGMTWQDIGAALPLTQQCPNPLLIDDQTYLVGCTQTPNGVYRTTDGAMTWTNVSQEGGNFAALVASDESIYWASPDGTMVRSTDKGATWSQTIGAGQLSSIHPIELPDGRIATLASNQVVVSSDHGTTWHAVSSKLKTVGGGGNGWVGLTYSKQRKAFYTWYWTCANGPIPVPTDAIMSFPFDYTTQ